MLPPHDENREAFDGDRLASLLAAVKPSSSKAKLNWKVSPNGGQMPTSTGRLSGISVPSVTFGASPASAARRRYAATPNSSNQRYPQQWAALQDLVAHLHARYLDGSALPFGDFADSIQPLWRIPGTPFTSAIVNFPGAAYPFHRDSGNVAGSWSLQCNLRGRFSGGGLLVLPEYGVALACDHCSVCVFPGGGLWHGVTPISGSRMSVVFYAKAGLRDAAASLDDEVAAGNKRRTEYEQTNAQ